MLFFRGQEKKSNYQKWIHKFGISTSLLLLAAMIGLPVAASLIYGIWPDFGELWPGFVAVVLFMAPYLPSETIGYMSVMGPGALYLSYITGNVTNLRMPATIGTINALGIKPNTDECHTLAIIACGASVITSIVIVALGVVVSGPLTPIIQAPVLQPAFDYVVPALFGGLVAQTVIKGKKEIFHYLIPLAVCLFFCYCTKVASAYYMLIVIAVSAAVAVRLSENREKRGKGRVDMRYQEYMDIIRTVNDRFRYYKSIESLFELDQWSGLPELGGTYRQQMSCFCWDTEGGAVSNRRCEKGL